MAEDVLVDMYPGAVKTSEIVIEILKITADSAVFKLAYDDSCCGGSTTEFSWPVDTVIDVGDCANSIGVSIKFPTVGTATVSMGDCRPATDWEFVYDAQDLSSLTLSGSSVLAWNNIGSFSGGDDDYGQVNGVSPVRPPIRTLSGTVYYLIRLHC